MNEPIDSTIKTAFQSPEISSWRALVMTYRMIFNVLETRLQKIDCTVSRLQVFVVLYFEGPTVPVKLANRLLVTRGNISTLLKRMLKEGLIEETYVGGGASAKRPAFKLSEKGEATFKEIYPAHAQTIRSLMPNLPDEMVNKLIEIQEKIYSQFGVGQPLRKLKRP